MFQKPCLLCGSSKYRKCEALFRPRSSLNDDARGLCRIGMMEYARTAQGIAKSSPLIQITCEATCPWRGLAMTISNARRSEGGPRTTTCSMLLSYPPNVFCLSDWFPSQTVLNLFFWTIMHLSPIIPFFKYKFLYFITILDLGPKVEIRNELIIQNWFD